MQTEDYVVLLVRNPQFNWVYDREGGKLEEQSEGALTLSKAPAGGFSVTCWEATTGEVLARQGTRSQGGQLTLTTPRVKRSAAAKLVRLSTR